MSNWARPSKYAYKGGNSRQRQADAARSAAAGIRKYSDRREPDMTVVNPATPVSTNSKTPLIIAVDVTASMASWPAEIFDRLPLLYNTLSQYREELEISFVAIGDARVFDWPLQASDFGKGFDLEKTLKSIYPEGAYKGSDDHAESYGLLPYWINTRVSIPDLDKPPFLIVFGDITMHRTHTPGEIKKVFGDDIQTDVDCMAEWKKTTAKWNTWFLRSPRCHQPQQTQRDWIDAVGEQKIVHIDDEPRAVDYAMGLIARSWGHFGDFKTNMSARQDQAKIDALEARILGND